MAYGILCAVCGRELTLDELEFLWSDVDFLDHGGHYAGVSPEDQTSYWQAMQELTHRAIESDQVKARER